MNESVYLFVYGTLRKEYGSSFVKEHASEMEYVGPASIYGQLYDIGEYPGAIPGSDANSLIEGDVLRLKNAGDFISVLDKYEDFDPLNPSDSEYVRARMKARMSDGSKVEVWVYFYNQSLESKSIIDGGNYLNYLKKRFRASEI